MITLFAGKEREWFFRGTFVTPQKCVAQGCLRFPAESFPCRILSRSVTFHIHRSCMTFLGVRNCIFLTFFSLRWSASGPGCARRPKKIRAYFAQVVHLINDEGFSPVRILSLRYELRLARLGL